jgi:cellulose synthase/poly-beta-1,6-N-acetylglucosamine synthase-like glycosyltransferase
MHDLERLQAEPAEDEGMGDVDHRDLRTAAKGQFPPSDVSDRVTESTTAAVPIGQLLVARGLISESDLHRALDLQRRAGGRLGEVLIAMGAVAFQDLYQALAEQTGLPRIPWPPPDPPRALPESLVDATGAMLVAEDATSAWIAVTEPLSPEQAELLAVHLQKTVQVYLATPWEWTTLWQRLYAETLRRRAVDRLAETRPDDSAATLDVRRLQVRAGAIALLFGASALWAPHVVTVAVNAACQLTYLLLAGLKAWLWVRGASRPRRIVIPQVQVDAIPDQELPPYTILVPLYREAHMVPELIRHLEELDYPKHLLDIRLLFEHDDPDTFAAAAALRLPYRYTFVRIPPVGPKTKPKACNYGLLGAKGEFVVIYDAEDRPEPDQLKKAVCAFRTLPPSVACLQAELQFHNGRGNLLTQWFTQEYSNWFGLLLPGLMALDVPIPLGGTSNHFRTAVLQEVGAWDPHNVTEDADLGIRLYKRGYRTAMLDAVTWEEANPHVGNWLRQRTRWIKGYMVTWIVHMRHPVRLLREMGVRGFLGFQSMVLGTALLPLLNLWFWGMLAWWLLWHPAWIRALFPGPLYYMAALLLWVGNFLFSYGQLVGMYAAAERRRRQRPRLLTHDLVPSAVLSPVYWLLITVAAYRAVWELVRSPYHWAKTHHGFGPRFPRRGLDGRAPTATGIPG